MTDVTDRSGRSAGSQIQAADEQKVPKRQTPFSQAFRDFIPTGWQPYDSTMPQPLDSVPSARTHRDVLAARFPGEVLVIPTADMSRQHDAKNLGRSSARPDSS